MLFDSKAYLARLDPSQDYTIHPLTGGVINFTVRAVKSALHSQHELAISPRGKGKFPDHGSLILKYAAPYVATEGESMPISRQRQNIEKLALALFTSPDGLLEHLSRAPGISIPQLLYHDPHAHVLIMSDLGPRDLLSDHLIKFITSCTPWSFNSCGPNGSRLGQFFAELHSPRIWRRIGPARMKEFENPTMKDFIFQVAVAPLQSRLERFGIPDASELYRRAEADFRSEDQDIANALHQEQSFILGDLWTGGILVENNIHDPDLVGVIDWEFAGAGRSVNGDMAQLLAHLHLHLMAAPAKSTAHEAAKLWIKGITSSYRRQSRVEKCDWAIRDISTPSFPPAASLTSVSALVMRSTFILHGREMVNNALEREWKCFCCKTPVNKDRCPLIKDMIARGAWYLRRAGRNEDEFREKSNWENVCGEKEQILLDLFLDCA